MGKPLEVAVAIGVPPPAVIGGRHADSGAQLSGMAVRRHLMPW